MPHPKTAEYMYFCPNARDTIRRIIGQQKDYNWDKVLKI